MKTCLRILAIAAFVAVTAVAQQAINYVLAGRVFLVQFEHARDTSVVETYRGYVDGVLVRTWNTNEFTIVTNRADGVSVIQANWPELSRGVRNLSVTAVNPLVEGDPSDPLQLTVLGKPNAPTALKKR